MDEKKQTLQEGPVDRTQESDRLIARVRRLEEEVRQVKELLNPTVGPTWGEVAERAGLSNQRVIETACDELRVLLTSPGLGAVVGQLPLRKGHEALDALLLALARMVD